jgi:hypothetical protein
MATTAPFDEVLDQDSPDTLPTPRESVSGVTFFSDSPT